MKTRSIVVLLLGFATIALGGLQNARLVHHSGLAATMQAVRAEDAWIVYQVPTPASRYVMCCMDWLGHGKVVATKTCHLGSSASSFNGTDHIANIDTSSMIVALHEENGAVRDVEVYSGGCPVDADGKTVHVVDNVSVDESLGVLDGIVGRADHRRGRDGALNAIALHETPRAVQILERIATGNGDTKLRGQAVFWIAQTGGRHGFDVARRLANDDSDHDVRRHAVFALTQSSDAGVFDALAAIARRHADAGTRSEAVFWLGQHEHEKALPVLRDLLEHDSDRRVREKAIFAISQVPGDESTKMLIDLAKHDADTHVRKQSLFWLGQKAERKIAEVLRDSAERDPNSEVREAAVFAISQRPHDEAIPALIDLARSHRDPAVRKKAIFWLSQMDDPRAVAAIEKILLQ